MNRWRYKRFHISYGLAWLSVGLLIGLVVGNTIRIEMSWFLIIPALLVVMTSLKSLRWYACLLLVVSGALLGYLRTTQLAGELRVYDLYIGHKVTLVGTVDKDPTLTNGSNVWQTELTSIKSNERVLGGSVFATVSSDQVLKRGDTVTVFGKMVAGFGNFRASMYRADLLHVVRPINLFLTLRDNFAEAVRKVMPEPEASLGLGFVVGQKSALPDDLVEQLKIVGLTHIVVASGYNLTILVRFARRLLARRSRYLAFVGSALLVVGFVLVSGFSASMNRAAVVTILSLLAWYFGRKFHPVQLILYVAAVSAFLNPLYLQGDLGWLLSFMAFGGVLVVAPIATRLIYKKDQEPNAVARLVIETLSAELMTLPIIIVSFGYIPVLALFANTLVAPVIPMAMLLTFIAGLVGLLLPMLSWLAMPATILIAYVVAIVKWLASPDWARLSVSVPFLWAVIWYAVLAVGTWFVMRRRKVDLLASSVVE